jgi:hypothetical protein
MRYAAKKTLGRLLIAHEIMKPSTNLALSSDFISGSSMAPAPAAMVVAAAQRQEPAKQNLGRMSKFLREKISIILVFRSRARCHY